MSRRNWPDRRGSIGRPMRPTRPRCCSMTRSRNVPASWFIASCSTESALAITGRASATTELRGQHRHPEKLIGGVPEREPGLAGTERVRRAGDRGKLLVAVGQFVKEVEQILHRRDAVIFTAHDKNGRENLQRI